MTKKDAIDIIKSECYSFNLLNFDRSTMVNTALDMAVKALEQEPCEDAVSRQAVLYALDTRWFDSTPMWPTTKILLLRKDLRELPSVTPYKVESEEDDK